jgi:hypothetical protein
MAWRDEPTPCLKQRLAIAVNQLIQDQPPGGIGQCPKEVVHTTTSMRVVRSHQIGIATHWKCIGSEHILLDPQFSGQC